jgi:hypothetical protein
MDRAMTGLVGIKSDGARVVSPRPIAFLLSLPRLAHVAPTLDGERLLPHVGQLRASRLVAEQLTGDLLRFPLERFVDIGRVVVPGHTISTALNSPCA